MSNQHTHETEAFQILVKLGQQVHWLQFSGIVVDAQAPRLKESCKSAICNLQGQTRTHGRGNIISKIELFTSFDANTFIKCNK